MTQRLKRMSRRLLFFLSIMGPGLITASADNDASGIATYSMAGSTYGYGFLWAILLITVGEVVTQEMAARMGAVTGKGLTDLIRERFGVRTSAVVVLGLILANLGTTTAQFAGIAVSGELFGMSRYILVPLAALLVWLLVARGSYNRVEKVLLFSRCTRSPTSSPRSWYAHPGARCCGRPSPRRYTWTRSICWLCWPPSAPP